MNRKRFLLFVLLVTLVITLPPCAAHPRTASPLPEVGLRATGYATLPAGEGQPLISVPSAEREYSTLGQGDGGSPFSFVVTADMREYCGPGYDTTQYFRGACEAIAALGSGAFMVSPGDIDPPANVKWTMENYIGAAYTWYPVVGNHEVETPDDMEWLRNYNYGTVNPGPSGCPETTYSFDHGNAHFVVLNEYCDTAGDTATDGDVPDHLYNWLVDDLSATDKARIFVFGHEPAYPQPDADNGRVRHMVDSLNQYAAHRDRFWNLLKDEGVVVYICGHTHNYSAVKIDGVWQLDAGHARGLGDTGARSTFIWIDVDGDVVTFKTYRDDGAGGPYTLAHSGVPDGPSIYLPLVMHAYPEVGGP